MVRPITRDAQLLGYARAKVTSSLPGFLARYSEIDANQLLASAGIDPAAVGDRAAMHSVRSILQLLENGAGLTGDDSFALEFAGVLPLKDLDVLGYVMLNAPTIGAGLESICRYYAVQQTRAKLTLIRGPNDAHLTCRIDVPGDVSTNQFYPLVLGVLTRYCREATGNPSWAPKAVLFTAAPPSDPSRYQQFFGAPVRFNQQENALVVSPADLELPVRSADPELLPILSHHADDLIASMPQTSEYKDIVRRHLMDLLRAGDVAIEDTATRMKTTPRSLQRRLREEGSSFQEILADTRLALAQRYLRDAELSLTEIAFLLGYSELSAFSRAFRRWTGQSPLDYRRSTTH